MAGKDFYYNKAKQEGYRSRAAYKLKQLQDAEHLFADGDVVVDLGAAPGGWLEVLGELVGSTGFLVGVDRASIPALASVDPPVRTIQADITDEAIAQAILDILPDGQANVVVSDMAPDMTGEYPVDQARSLYLAKQAAGIADAILAPRGHFLVKVFDGDGVADFRAELEERYEWVGATTPAASRDSSSERYLVAKRYLRTPVTVGERVEVVIEEEGADGDGVALIDGYPLFIPATEPGDRLVVTVTDLKADFGFAQRAD